MYRFIRERKGSADENPYASTCTGRLFVQGNSGNLSSDSLPYSSSSSPFSTSNSPSTDVSRRTSSGFDSGKCESRVEERHKSIVTISFDNFDEKSNARIQDETSDAVTRIFVNESPGFRAANKCSQSLRDLRGRGLESEVSDVEAEEGSGDKKKKSKHKLVKRRRNITEEETVTVCRRIRRVKSGRAINEEQEVPQGSRLSFHSEVT